jgi:hypothetical protein
MRTIASGRPDPGADSSSPRRWSAVAASLLAIAFVGASLAYEFVNETPTGRVAGSVYLAESDAPLADASVTLTALKSKDRNPDMTEEASRPNGDADIRERREVDTDEDGTFEIPHVPVGRYTVSATSDAHQSTDVDVTVTEAQTATTELKMTRSQPDLQVAEHQSVFSTSERASLPVRGYVAAGPNDSLHVQIYRTRLAYAVASKTGADLLNAQGAPDTTGPIPDDLLRPVAGDPAPGRIMDEAVPVKNIDAEGFFTQKLPIPPAGAGLYLISVTHAGTTVHDWMLCTDMALVVKRSRHQLVAYAANMQTGVPIGGAHVRQYRAGHLAADAGFTAPDGVATLNAAQPSANDEASGDAPATITIASSGDDDAVVTRGAYFDETTGKDVVHLYTDRTVYRPGDTISYKAIVRRKAPTAGGYRIPRGVPVTVEITDTNGDRVARTRTVTDSHGMFHDAFTLSSEAPTGTYSAVVTVDGEQDSTDIAVASYRKPEFTVTVTPVQPRYLRGQTAAMTVAAHFYYGAPVAGATVHYEVYRDIDWSTVYGDDDSEDDDNDHSGDDNFGGAYYGSTVVQGDVTLGADGTAVVPFPTTRDTDSADAGAAATATSPEDTPEQETYTLTATVTDDAKREVDAEGAVAVSAADLIVRVTPAGYLGQPGQPSNFLVEVTDHDGKPVANVPVALTPLYERTKRNEDGETEQTEDRLPLIRGRTDAGGTAVLTVTPPSAGDMQIVVQATDSGGRVAYTRSGLWVESDTGEDLTTQVDDLSLHTDKRRYQAGDTARVLINTSRIGESVLLTVEGERVYAHYVVPIRQHSSIVRVPVEAGYGPNVSLVACYVKDKRFARGDATLRVALTQRLLNVTVSADRARYLPGGSATMSVRITDSQGRPVAGCPFSLGVVDEAIYALREDDPKAIVHDFYPHREDSVDTDYSFNIGYLGDADKSEPKITARKRFLDTAFWMPDGETDGAGRARVTVTFPDNLTTWRTSVYACTDDTAVGYGKSTVIVTKPFFLRLDTPRFLTQGDHGRFLTIVHNDTGADRDVRLHLQATSVDVSGEAIRSLSVKAGADATVDWPITARTAGNAAIRATAWTTDGSGFTDGVESSVPIKAWGRTEFTAVAGVVRGADPAGGVRLLRLDPNASPGSARLVIRVTPSVSGALVGGLDYLVGYPYGCTEQTLSRFLPDVEVARLQRQTGRRMLGGTTGDTDLTKMVRDGLVRLRNFEHDDSGGWGWWQHDEDDPYMTAYVLVGLATARDAGYAVPDAMVQKGRKAAGTLLKDAAEADVPYLLYALTLSGDRKTALRVIPRIPLRKVAPDGLAYLVLTERALGMDPRQGAAYLELERRSHAQGSLLYWKNPEQRWNGSDRIATALGLRAYLAADPADVRVPLILRWLMDSRTDSYFGDTRDTACVLMAFCDYLALHPADAQPSGILTASVNGRAVASLDLATAAQELNADRNESGFAASEVSAERVLAIPAAALHAGENRLEITRSAEAPAAANSETFFTATLTQTVASPDGSALPPLPAPPEYRGLTVTREYRRVLDRPTSGDPFELATEESGNRFQQGDNVRVRLTIVAPRDLAYVLIEDPYPSCFEPTERGTADQEFSPDDTWGWWYSNVDVRDDRIALFARTIPKGTHVFEYNMHAQTPGECNALPTRLQGMYAEAAHTESGDDHLEVRE